MSLKYAAERDTYNQRQKAQYKSLSRVPGFLQANKEARDECLKFFSRAFPEELCYSGRRTTERCIYINPVSDFLVVKVEKPISHFWDSLVYRPILQAQWTKYVPRNIAPPSKLPENDDWATFRGIWSISSLDNPNLHYQRGTVLKRRERCEDCMILIKMFEHSDILEHNERKDVRGQLNRLGWDVEDSKVQNEPPKTHCNCFFQMELPGDPGDLGGWDQCWMELAEELELDERRALGAWRLAGRSVKRRIERLLHRAPMRFERF